MSLMFPTDRRHTGEGFSIALKKLLIFVRIEPAVSHKPQKIYLRRASTTEADEDGAKNDGGLSSQNHKSSTCRCSPELDGPTWPKSLEYSWAYSHPPPNKLQTTARPQD